MQIITADMVRTLERLVGVREPEEITRDQLSALENEGLFKMVNGRPALPEHSVRATAPQYMKDITP